MARHRLSRVFAGILLASALTVGASTEWSSTVVAQQAPFRWQGQLAAGQTIEVRGINGDIRATGVPGADAEVTAVKQRAAFRSKQRADQRRAARKRRHDLCRLSDQRW